MINSLRLQSFRSYTDDSYEFDSGVNIIVGPNASGKTNLLESLLVIAQGMSYRSHDEELIMFNKPWARIDGLTDDTENRTVKLLKQPGLKIRKEFIIENLVLIRLNSQRKLPVILFEPTHLQLLQGSPNNRRDYLDDLLEELNPSFKNIRRQYIRTLAQRNALLKKGFTASDQLFSWNIRLSELGGQLAVGRLRLINEMNLKLSVIYSNLSQKKATVSIHYQSNIASDQYSSDLLYKLERSHDQDFTRGYTTFGPHRDDMSVTLNGYQVQDTASRGEIRTILLAFKLIEMSLVESHYGRRPILLLDDVFSELDGARRRALTEALNTHQTFITTTDADIVMQHFSESAKIILAQSNS
ncbi:MAG: DNA replication/repair protein RecF [Candidatus Saccharimonadales bacterium]